VALLDRIVWQVPADPVQALREGLVDWLERLPPKLPDAARDDPNLVVTRLDDIGYYAILRLNARQGIMANQRVRQTLLAAIDQTAVMEAVFGEDTASFTTPVGLFPPGSEYASDAGIERIGAKRSPRAIQAMLKDAGYNGETVIVLNPADDAIHTALTAAVIDQARRIGLSIEERKLDRGAFATQRENPEDNAWSAVCESLPGADLQDPPGVPAGRAPSDGRLADWPDDPRAGLLRDTWIDAYDLGVKRGVAARLQDQVFMMAGFVPLGQWFPATAWRKPLDGQQKGPCPVFWNVARN
jgi:peptide/nickel transport system substrate-binding protein